MNISKKEYFFGLTIVIFLTAIAFLLYWEVTKIYIPYPAMGKKKISVDNYPDTVKIGVVSRFTPEKIYKGYQPIMDYLTKKTHYLFELKLSPSYKQTLTDLREGKVTAAFLGSFIFAQNIEPSLQAVLKPLNKNGKPFLHSVLFVRGNSKIRSPLDLKGKSVAVPSRESFSGNWLQLIELRKYGLTQDSLKKITHFSYHNSVVLQVLMHNFDAGVVKERVANEYLNRGIRIIAYSEEIPSSPIVISKKSNKKKVSLFVSSLLNLKNNKIRKNWDPEFMNGFVKADNSDYYELKKLIYDR